MAGLNAQLAARNIGTSLSQSDYDQLLEAYGYVHNSVGNGLGASAPDIFDFLSTHLHVQDIKNLATKGIDPLSFKTTLEELLIEGAENRHLIHALRELPDARSLEEFSEKLTSLGLDSRRLLYTDLGTPSFAEAIRRDVGLVDAWEVLNIDDVLRKNPADLEKLSKFMKETGADKTKLIESFKNTPDARKWVDMKIPQAELDNIYNGFKNDPPFDLDPWTPQHKAERWAQYKAEKGDAGLDFKSWSNVYDGNIKKVATSKKGVDDYFSSVGWGRREVTIDINGQKRRLDIADEGDLKGIEFKEYSEGKVYATEMIRREVELDGLLVGTRGWEMEWIFKGCEPSGPLKKLIEDAGIKITLLN